MPPLLDRATIWARRPRYGKHAQFHKGHDHREGDVPMTIWEIQRQEGTFGVFLADNSVSRAAHAGGVNPTAVRDAFKAASLNEVRFLLVEESGGRTIEA